MRKIKLYRVEPFGHAPLFLAARDNNHAAEIFATVRVAEGSDIGEFSIGPIDETLPKEQRLGLADMLAHGVTGIAVMDPLFGWCVSMPV